MAKKSHKRFPRWRKENSCCMSGLISMFDFREGRSTQRLLSDKKRGSARNLGVSYSSSKDDIPCNKEKSHRDAENLDKLSDIEAEEADMVDLGMASIKTLMEKDMSKVHHSRKESSSKTEWLKVELELEANGEKSHKERAKNSVVGSDVHAEDLNVSTRLISQQSDYQNISEILSSDIDDVAAFLVDYCSTTVQFEDNQLEFKNKADQYPSPLSIEDLRKRELVNESVTTFKKVVVDIAKTLLKQKSINSSKPIGNKQVQPEEEFNNALEMLNSNKDLFLKLLQDPESPIQKYIQGLQNVYIGKPSELDENRLLGKPPGSKQQLQKQSSQHFIRKIDKLTVQNQSNKCGGTEGVNRIVVLKPSSVRNKKPSNTVSSISSSQSHCGLENPEGGERLSSHFSLKEIKRKFRNAVGASRKERRSITMDGILHKIPYGKQINSECETSFRREAIVICDEKKSNSKEIGKKNDLSFSADIVREHKKLNKNAAPQMLHREAAFCDEARKHLAELLQIGSESESPPAIRVSKSLGKLLSFPEFNYLSPRLSPAIEKEPASPQKKTPKYLSPSKYKKSLPMEDTSQAANNEFEDNMQVEENSKVKEQFVSISLEDDLPNGIFKEEESPMLLEPGYNRMCHRYNRMCQFAHTASSSAVVQEPRDTTECAIDNTGRPSPVSVLEPLYFEDVTSHASLITEHGIKAETKTQPIEHQIETSAATSSSVQSIINTVTSMDEFDEASLFDALEISFVLLINHPKLLFDLIDEVVSEIKERHFSCTPWVSSRRLHKQEDFINEAYKRINWHLDVHISSTLKQAVKKDFGGGVWFNLQIEAENAVTEIGNEILDSLFEEIALDLWD